MLTAVAESVSHVVGNPLSVSGLCPCICGGGKSAIACLGDFGRGWTCLQNLRDNQVSCYVLVPTASDSAAPRVMRVDEMCMVCFEDVLIVMRLIRSRTIAEKEAPYIYLRDSSFHHGAIVNFREARQSTYSQESSPRAKLSCRSYS